MLTIPAIIAPMSSKRYLRNKVFRRKRRSKSGCKCRQTFIPGMFSEAVLPPSTGSAWPVMKLASSLARKVIAAASSSGRP